MPINLQNSKRIYAHEHNTNITRTQHEHNMNIKITQKKFPTYFPNNFLS